MNQIVKDIINEINDAQIQKGRGLLIYEMQPIMEKYIAKIERPQGEWIMDKEHTKNPLLWYKCNLCGVYHSPTNFCPNCGAQMKGSTE